MSPPRVFAAADPASSAKDRLLGIALALSQERDVRALLRRFTEGACELLDAQYGALFIEDTGRLEEFITCGLDPDIERRIHPLPTRTGLHGFLLREGKTVRIDDLATDPRCIGFPAHHPVMHSFIGTSIRYRDQTLGELFLTDKRDGGSFSVQDEEIIEALAAQAAVAYYNARLLAAERDAADRAEMLLQLQKSQHGREEMLRRLLWAQEEERARIARELHDGLGQVLASLALGTRGLADQAHGALSERLEACEALSERALVEARSLVSQLRPMELDELGLFPALERLCEETQRVHGVHVHLYGSGLDERFGREVETAAYRIVQEAVSNTLKHARASSLTIFVTDADKRLKIIIMDDGVGFEAATVTGRGLRGEQMGLLSMQERSESVGGKLTVESQVRRGTVVTLEVPVAGQGKSKPPLIPPPDTATRTGLGTSGAARVLLVDDHAVVRDGLRLLVDREPDLQVCGEASSLHQALTCQCEPDVVLTDLMLGDDGGAVVVARLRERFADAGLLVLSMVDNARDIQRALRAGANGYLLKGAGGAELLDAVRRVARGEEYVQPSLGAAFSRWRESCLMETSSSHCSLTPRQRDVLTLIVRGHTNAEIARLLSVTVRTVEAHRAHIFQRLDIKTRAELVSYATETGLIELHAG